MKKSMEADDSVEERERLCLVTEAMAGLSVQPRPPMVSADAEIATGVRLGRAFFAVDCVTLSKVSSTSPTKKRT